MWSLYTVVFLSALLPATCAIDCELTLNITRNLSGPALNGPVVIRANNASSIWCSLICMRRRGLSDFFWRYSNGTRVPVVDRGEPSDHDVYAERYAGTIGNSTETTWRSILHFQRAQPSSAGNYTCVADYRQETTYKSVEVQVTGVKGTSPMSSGTSSASSDTSPKSSGTSPTSSGIPPTSSGTSLTSSGTSLTSSGIFPTNSETSPTNSGTFPTNSGTSPTSSGTFPTNSGTSSTSSSSAGSSGVTLGTVPLAVTASVGIIVLLLLGCVAFVILVVVVYRKYHSRKTFRPEELYDTSDMECVPVGTKKEVMVLADLTTNVLSCPGDAIGQPLKDDKESEFEDNHSITEAYAEVSVVAVAGLNEPKHTDVTQDKAQPGNGGEELPMGLAVEVQDYSLVQKRETTTSPEAVHLRAKAFQANQFVEHVKRMHEETVGLTESTAMSHHVAMETNPAYGVCFSKQ